MINKRWLFLATLVSFSSFGAVSFKEKQLRVKTLMKMQKAAPALAFEAYQRELGYEAKGLSIDMRAKNETNLLAEKMRSQVRSAYEAALLRHQSPQMAREEVKDAIERDLEMAAPELREELTKFSLESLNNIEVGEVNREVQLDRVEAALKKEVVNRKQFLNQEDVLQEQVQGKVVEDDAMKESFDTRAELMESLTSERPSSPWVESSNQVAKTVRVTSADINLSLQVKMEYLGVALEAGPTISFSRNFVTSGTIMSEGLKPVILTGGEIDRFVYDRNNKRIIKDGKPLERYTSFWCDAELKFGSRYAGGGGFKYMGLGGGVTISKSFEQGVSVQSRRISLPKTVANKYMTSDYISELCHKDFLRARVNGTITIRESLNVMMKNVISGIVFVNPKTKCATTNHCKEWFDKEVISLKKKNNTYRCVENIKDKYRFCQLRGTAGQSCPVIEGGKLVSSGSNEYPCAGKLKCIKTHDATTFYGNIVSPAKGTCQKR